MTERSRSPWLRTAVLGALALALLACAGQAPKAAPTLTELHGVADLTAAFDRDAVHPRLVLLLSPT